MARNETVILTNMCMVTNEKGEWLIENRINPVWGGLVFPGGHVEAKESIAESVIREVKAVEGFEDLLNVFLDDTISELCYEGIQNENGSDEARFF